MSLRDGHQDAVRVVLGGPLRHAVVAAAAAAACPSDSTEALLLADGKNDDGHVDVVVDSNGAVHAMPGNRSDAVWVWVWAADDDDDDDNKNGKAYAAFAHEAARAGRAEVVRVELPHHPSASAATLWRAAADAHVRHSLRVAELMP